MDEEGELEWGKRRVDACSLAGWVRHVTSAVAPRASARSDRWTVGLAEHNMTFIRLDCRLEVLCNLALGTMTVDWLSRLV